MKIAFVTPQMIVGGAETYIIRKSEWLIQHGHEVIIISEGGVYVDYLPSSIQHFYINFESYNQPYAVSRKIESNIIMQLSNVLIKEKVNLIEAHATFPIFYVIMSYKYHKTPFIYNNLAEVVYDKSKELYNLTSFLDRKNLFATLTSDMSEYISDKCGHLLSPIILPIPIPIPKPVQNHSAPYDYILTVCRLDKDKMYLKYLIQEFEIVCSSNKYIKLLIVGSGPLYEEINHVVNISNRRIGNERILLLGEIVGEKLDCLFAGALAYVGVGTTLIVSASYKKPCIIASGFIQSCVPYAWGFWGEYPERDRNVLMGIPVMRTRRIAFSEIITKVLASPHLRDRMGILAYKLFSETYELDMVMKHWDRVYNDISLRQYDSAIAFKGEVLRIRTRLLHAIQYIYRHSFKLLLRKDK